MNFCILRTAKLRTFGSIAGSAKHNLREIAAPNVNSALSHMNWTSGAASAAEVCKAVHARLPEKRRKDAVLCIEYLVTASPEWFKTVDKRIQTAYFNGAIAWLRKKHGKDNIVCLNLQLDETTPHLVCYVVPRTSDGRLAAKDFLGGRKILSAMQTDFWSTVGKPVGLIRGLEGSTAKHTSAKQYSAALALNPTLEPPIASTITLSDRIFGRGKEMQKEHLQKNIEYTRLVEQTRRQADFGQTARSGQVNAIARLRLEVATLEKYKLQTERLQRENVKLQDEVARQSMHFRGRWDELVTMLEKSKQEIGILRKQVQQFKALAEEAWSETRLLLRRQPKSKASSEVAQDNPTYVVGLRKGA